MVGKKLSVVPEVAIGQQEKRKWQISNSNNGQKKDKTVARN